MVQSNTCFLRDAAGNDGPRWLCGIGYKGEYGGYIDDTVVTTKVKTALFNDKDIKSSEISVQTFKGRVQLSGFVSSAESAKRAIEVTRRVQGVRMVENDLRIK